MLAPASRSRGEGLVESMDEDFSLTKVLKFTPREIAEIKASGATGEAPKAPSQKAMAAE